jgi:hypothetical protein
MNPSQNSRYSAGTQLQTEYTPHTSTFVCNELTRDMSILRLDYGLLICDTEAVRGCNSGERVSILRVE